MLSVRGMFCGVFLSTFYSIPRRRGVGRRKQNETSPSAAPSNYKCHRERRVFRRVSKTWGGGSGPFSVSPSEPRFFFFLFFSFLATPRASRIHFLPLCSSEDRSSLGGFRESGLEDGGRKRKFDDYLKSEKFTIGIARINNSAIATWQVQ